jgi:hypothetical protein
MENVIETTTYKLKLETIKQLMILPDNLVYLVLDYIESINAQNTNSMSNTSRMESLKALQSLNIRVPDNFDESKELMDGLNEKK